MPRDDGPNLKDPLDRHIARNLAKSVLADTDPEDPTAALRVEYAHRLLERVRQHER